METREEIAAIHKELREQGLKLDRVLRVLTGDEELVQTGLIKKVADQEKWIDSQKLHMAKIAGIAIGSGLFGGVITQLFMFFLNK